MLTVHGNPELRSPVLLCAFGGWADAASAPTGALRYLLIKRDGNRIAEFDPDAIYNYTTTRPVTMLDGKGGRRLQWPELAWTAVEVPEAPSDLVILLGPEPDLRWRECVDAIIDFSETLGVSRLVAYGAFLAQVHYSGTPSMMGVSFDPSLRARLRGLGIEQSNYQGPTSFVTAILSEAHQRGIPAASLWVAAPSYLSNTSNPKLAAALLKVSERLLGQDLWTAELEAAGNDMERRIEEAIRSRPDLATFLRNLEGEDSNPEVEELEIPEVEIPEPTAEDSSDPPLPSAEEVLRDLEEHLRRLKGDPEDPEDS